MSSSLKQKPRFVFENFLHYNHFLPIRYNLSKVILFKLISVLIKFACHKRVAWSLSRAQTQAKPLHNRVAHFDRCSAWPVAMPEILPQGTFYYFNPSLSLKTITVKYRSWARSGNVAAGGFSRGIAIKKPHSVRSFDCDTVSLSRWGFRRGSFRCYDDLGGRHSFGRRSDHRIRLRDGSCRDIGISHDKNKFAIWTACDYSASLL